MEKQSISSDSGNPLYEVIAALFVTVQQLSNNGLCGWVFDGSYTNHQDEHFVTIYTNGKVSIKAESVDGVHTYTYGPVEDSEQ